MKSVDRDFESYGYVRSFWILAYLLMTTGVICMFLKVWDEVHLRGLSFHILIRIIVISLVYICPLLLSFRFRRYIRSALIENLFCERVAKNCEFLIGQQLMIVYVAIMMLIIWNWN